MATAKQIAAAKKNIKKAQKAWKEMSHTEHARAQPQGRGRKRPGTTGEGEFYRIEVRPKSEFVTFRNQDVGDPGGIERLAGKRASGSWDTVKWMIKKEAAHEEGTDDAERNVRSGRQRSLTRRARSADGP